ncbi:MAG: hypothetical protein L7U50_04385, partial [Candidatus Nanopelagicales bacterium]|nr:hypothetical protein [Candidatus Nanopelagicales bacterium]
MTLPPESGSDNPNEQPIPDSSSSGDEQGLPAATPQWPSSPSGPGETGSAGDPGYSAQPSQPEYPPYPPYPPPPAYGPAPKTS